MIRGAQKSETGVAPVNGTCQFSLPRQSVKQHSRIIWVDTATIRAHCIMPKLNLQTIPVTRGTGYPREFQAASKDRLRQRIGDAGALTDFGVNLTRLPPGNWSAQRHWHSHEDEFVYVIEGEVVLIQDEGETILRSGDCAAFPKGIVNGHHLVNRSTQMATYLEIGSRQQDDVTVCSDVDMKSANADGRFVHKDGTPYPEQ